ncbi:MAG: hypothetical protein ACD_56C00093G0015 [uncultured bacterium]|nr:MAG: hypothetical protein ACD_56C00093G0015 [uncultured bacterium]
MQKFFQDLQGKLWIQLVELFNKLTSFYVETWQSTEPFRRNTADFFALASEYLNKTLEFAQVIIAFLFRKISELFVAANKQYDNTEPIAVNFSRENKLGAWLIIASLALSLLFWIWMIWHAKRNETGWKKSWIFFMLISGPFGALIYYIFRKRKKESDQDKHDKVMMSFFSPMHKNSKESKK